MVLVVNYKDFMTFGAILLLPTSTPFLYLMKNEKDCGFTMTPLPSLAYRFLTTSAGDMRLTSLESVFDEDYEGHIIFNNPSRNLAFGTLLVRNEVFHFSFYEI